MRNDAIAERGPCGCPCNRWPMSLRPTWTISTTDSSGTAKTSPSISTIKLGRMASVKGSLMVKVVPRPARFPTRRSR